MKKSSPAKKLSEPASQKFQSEEFFDEGSSEEYYDEVPKKPSAVAPKTKVAAKPVSASKAVAKSTPRKPQSSRKTTPAPMYESGSDDVAEEENGNVTDARPPSLTSRSITSISGAYKNHYEEYVADSQESSDEDSQDPNVDPQTRAEKALIKTIKRFATYVSAITSDLEKQEAEDHAALKKRGKPVPAPIWADSTFKIDFTKGLLLKVFQPSRLMKYYIIFILPMRKWLEARDEEFFLKAKVFPGAPEEDIRFFRDLWSIEGTLTKAEKNTIWDYWDTQLAIVDDWKEITGWEINPNEKLNIPDIDYDKAARDAGLH